MKKFDCKILSGLQKLRKAKWLKVMRIVLFFITMSITQSFALGSYAYTTRLSLNVKNQPAAKILDNISEGFGFAYKVEDKQIPLNNSNAIFNFNQVNQQQRTVSGKVTDAYGQPLPGVTVVVKGTTQGMITNADGEYSLTNIPEDATLVFSFVGMRTQEVVVGSQTTIDITMEEEAIGLEEVVAIGYGSKRKGDITSAISVIDIENIGDVHGLDVSRLIVGQAPGVVVKQTTGGKPGVELEISIRGLGSLGATSTPLYVVDGFPLGTSTQQSLNYNDIESITILKDAASTSIYGARGANGVILITTKGAKGDEIRLTATANFGVQNIPDNRRIKMMNGVEFAQFKKESYEDRIRYYENREPTIDEIPIDFRYPEQTKYSTDWFDEIVNNNALVQSYNVTMSEGQGKIKSLLSLGYVKQDGAIIKTNFERFNARANLTGDINNHISLGWNLSASRSNERLIGTEGRDAIVGVSLMADPREPVYNEDGTWNDYLGGHDGIFGYPNPVMVLHQTKNMQNINRILSNGYVEITFLNDFKFKPSINVSLLNLRRNDFRPSTLAAVFAPPPRNATMTEWSQETVNYNADMLLTYTKKINDHSFDAMLGYTAQEEIWKAMTGSGSKFPNDEIRMFQNAEIFSLNSNESSWSLLAYFTRLNYNFKDRYLFSASFRKEGSSRFGADNRWGNFPSVSAGWKLSEEEFMPKFSWLSVLKLRGSYGVTGNNNIGNYLSLAGLNSSDYIIGGSLAPGVVLGSFANPKLAWEKSNSLDLGLDLSLFGNKLMYTFEYYNKITDNMLLTKEIPIISGFPWTYTNVGKIQNRGVEMALDYKTKVTNDLYLHGNFNISFNRNKVLELIGENDYLENFNFYNYYNRSVVGKPIGMFYGYKWLGIFNTDEEIANSPTQEGAVPGVYKYWDANNDGEITYDTQDMVEIGNPHPKFVWALTLGGDYKHFDFNILFTGMQDYDLIRNIEGTIGNLDGVFNVAAAAKDRWRSAENPGKGVYPTTKTWKWEREVSSRYVYDASHAWVKSVSIGYTIPGKNGMLKGMRFYVNAENLFLITNYPGSNPEININGGINPGRDDEAYPVPRIFSIGTSITF